MDFGLLGLPLPRCVNHKEGRPCGGRTFVGARSAANTQSPTQQHFPPPSSLGAHAQPSSQTRACRSPACTMEPHCLTTEDAAAHALRALKPVLPSLPPLLPPTTSFSADSLKALIAEHLWLQEVGFKALQKQRKVRRVGLLLSSTTDIMACRWSSAPRVNLMRRLARWSSRNSGCMAKTVTHGVALTTHQQQLNCPHTACIGSSTGFSTHLDAPSATWSKQRGAP